jgi:hypothetical protein
MTPQCDILVLAPVEPEQVAPLRALLATMNAKPGHADPANALVPFGLFPEIHVARFVVLVDETRDDLKAFGREPRELPIYLAFLVDADGAARDVLDQLAARAGAGLGRIFAHCADFTPGEDVRAWMGRHLVRAQAVYRNWPGRTVRQVREEAALRSALSAELRRAQDEGEVTPQALHARLRTHVRDHGPPLSPEPPTPTEWSRRHLWSLVSGLAILAVAVPLIVIAAPLWLPVLRYRETSDPEITAPSDRRRQEAISALEDHEVTNPFSAIGTIKPGAFRFALVSAALWLINFGSEHIYKRGRLARVGTIHFARWIVIDGGERVLFVSNYDGSLEAYMDDFINKVAFGLNLAFSNGVGYPTTSFLLFQGAKREEQFKAFLRRRQQLTDVWYKAYPGLTAFDLARNSEIRKGLEDPELTGAPLVAWLAKI